MLEENRGSYISGERIAAEASVSRAAVWKSIRALQGTGVPIDAVPNKGYALAADSDIVSETALRRILNGSDAPFRFDLHRSVSSTNELAKRAGDLGEAEGLVIVAEEQTAGKGRLNRRFHSPGGSGIYLSILLRPKIQAQDALMITTAAAVAAAEAIGEVTQRDARIKWVNDIFCHGGKCGGILTEASISMENGTIDYAVMGIGMNIREPEGGFPPEIRGIAAAILEPGVIIPDVRCRLIAAFLRRFWEIYRHLPEKHHLNGYRERSMLIGEQVMVISGNSERPAVVLGIDGDCRLVVRWEDGAEAALSTGEVSVRKTEGKYGID